MRQLRHRTGLVFLVVIGACLAWPVTNHATLAERPVDRAALPARLSDAQFWTLVSDISEPGGYFRITDNFTSNELEIGQVFGMLREGGVDGGVYIGVGPEQNLTYIAAIRPSMAFIVDIRRQAVMQHLMFKAIFELAEDRAAFISLLFSKPRPADLNAKTPIAQMWTAFSSVAPDADAETNNATRIVRHLTETHKFALTDEELVSLKSVLAAFVSLGPTISTRGGGGFGFGNNAGGGFARGGSGGTFADLTGWSVDASGTPQSFLSTEEHFLTVKTLQEKNLVVPVSGDFGGPKAIRAIGAYLHEQGGVVSAFYVSNVEQYLFQDGKSKAFYDNVATLPLSDRSVFIRPYALRRGGGAPATLCPIRRFIDAANAGRVYSNNDTLVCTR